MIDGMRLAEILMIAAHMEPEGETMGEIEKFPSKGILRNEAGEETAAYRGYTKEEAEAKVAESNDIMRSLPLAAKMAQDKGYETLADVPEQERFALVREALRLTKPANED